MPPAEPLSRQKVERRSNETTVDPKLIEKLVRKARVIAGDAAVITGNADIIDGPETARFAYNLNWTIESYLARVLADKQERPAQIVAALTPGVEYVKDVLAWLDTLPVSELIALQAGGWREQLEAMVSRVEDRRAYLQQHVEAHRPDGAEDAGLALRRALTAIITAHWPDPPDATDEQKCFREQRRRAWVASVCHEIDADYPNEKKHRQRFTGEHQQKKRHSREGLMAYVAGVIEKQLRNHEAMRAIQKRWFIQLQGVPI